MPKRWTSKEEAFYRKELTKLYLHKNLSISEVATSLKIGQATVYDRLVRLGIKSIPSRKLRFCNQRIIDLPKFSKNLAEIIGILLGDGHISEGQVWFTLGSKEQKYTYYIENLFFKVFGYHLKRCRIVKKYTSLYIGSKALVTSLKKMGLVQHKVKSQVGVPDWILNNKQYYPACLRGIFDTDGSIYKLRHGHQISFKNMSLVLLKDIRSMLIKLKFSPSQISNFSVYITKRKDLRRFKELIGSGNPP